jgi:hypothetical protein
MMCKHCGLWESSGAARELKIADMVGKNLFSQAIETTVAHFQPLLDQVGISRIRIGISSDDDNTRSILLSCYF